MSNTFRFKQFTIKQDKTAMKVGTDGVLLGAWSSITEKSILDIGTGTGLIALMLAQRTKKATIDAIEIEEQAYLQTLENSTNSKWAKRIRAHHVSIQNFTPFKKYQLIVSNPPYFNRSFKSPKGERTIARHTSSLSYEDLITAVVSWLDISGNFSVVLPVKEGSLFINMATNRRLFLNKKCLVKPNPNKKPKRTLLSFSFQEKTIEESEIIIETEIRHDYTPEYKALTQDFYLAF